MTRRIFQVLVPWIPPALWLAGIAVGPDNGSIPGAVTGSWIFCFGLSLVPWSAFWPAFSKRHTAISLSSAVISLSIGLISPIWLLRGPHGQMSFDVPFIALWLAFISGLLAGYGATRFFRAIGPWVLVTESATGPCAPTNARDKITLRDLFGVTALVAIIAALARNVFEFSHSGSGQVDVAAFVMTGGFFGAIASGIGFLFALAILCSPANRAIQVWAMIVCLGIWFVSAIWISAVSANEPWVLLILPVGLTLSFAALLGLARFAGYRLVREGDVTCADASGDARAANALA